MVAHRAGSRSCGIADRRYVYRLPLLARWLRTRRCRLTDDDHRSRSGRAPATTQYSRRWPSWSTIPGLGLIWETVMADAAVLLANDTRTRTASRGALTAVRRT
jgi:hypothetical protein